MAVKGVRLEWEMLYQSQHRGWRQKVDSTNDKNVGTPHSNIPAWVALRNRLIHVDAMNDDQLIWDTLSGELRRLVAALKAVMRDAPMLDGAAQRRSE